MLTLFDRLNEWYLSLQDQEKRILKYGVPVIALLILYLLVIQPLASTYFSRQSEMSQRVEDLVWIRDQREHLQRLNTSCDLRGPIFSEDTFRTDIEAAARRFGMAPVVRELPQAAGYQLQITNAEGNRILSLVRMLSCSGVRVSQLEIQKTPVNAQSEDGEFSANLSIEISD